MKTKKTLLAVLWVALGLLYALGIAGVMEMVGAESVPAKVILSIFMVPCGIGAWVVTGLILLDG